MPDFSRNTRPSKLQQILILGRSHWDHDGFDPDSRHAFLRALNCKTPVMGGRLFSSSRETGVFYNTCKSQACSSCGHWATVQWQRERWCALPEGPYFGITFTMPDTLWPFFARNERLLKKLPEIAGRVILNYADVRYAVEVGAMPVLHTFNGELFFKPHVHTLVIGNGLPRVSSRINRRMLFHLGKLLRSWQRLVIALLRSMLAAGELGPGSSCEEIELLLESEENRPWIGDVQELKNKEGFVGYIGRYVRRPPIAVRRITAIEGGCVRFWYEEKHGDPQKTVLCTIEEFIDRWSQHIRKRYRHAVRHFGLFAPRRWRHAAMALFAKLGQIPRPRPKRRPWAASVSEQFGRNPRVDSHGEQMEFVRHLAPTRA